MFVGRFSRPARLGTARRRIGRRLFPVRRDQELDALTRAAREFDPDVAQDRRVLQMPAVVFRTEEDELDEHARNLEACHDYTPIAG